MERRGNRPVSEDDVGEELGVILSGAETMEL